MGRQSNQCDICGRFIAFADFTNGSGAIRRLVTPDSQHSTETYETLCKEHARDHQTNDRQDPAVG
jgi:hypothetical protein